MILLAFLKHFNIQDDRYQPRLIEYVTCSQYYPGVTTADLSDELDWLASKVRFDKLAEESSKN